MLSSAVPMAWATAAVLDRSERPDFPNKKAGESSNMTIHSRQPRHRDKLPEDLVSVEEIVRMGWCSRSKMDWRVSRGVIPSYIVDGAVRVSKSETGEILKQLGEKAGGSEGIAPADISVEAYNIVAKSILENIGILDAGQRSQLAGMLTGVFDADAGDVAGRES